MSVRLQIRAVAVWVAVACGVAFSNSAAAEEDANNAARTCLHHPSIKRTKVLNDRNILFVMRDGSMYNNMLPRQCPGMKRNGQLSYTYSNNSDICSGSTFTVLQRVGTGTNTVAYTNPATNEHIALPAPAFVATFVCPMGLFVPTTQDEVDLIVATTETPRNRREKRRGNRDLIEAQPLEAAPATP
jgi:hypothetical protein